jgi:hypothetical protein
VRMKQGRDKKGGVGKNVGMKNGGDEEGVG